MKPKHRAEFIKLFGTPVFLEAADFGYIHRPRLYFGLSDCDFKSSPISDCTHYSAPGTLLPDTAVLSWVGDPSPEDWTPDDDYVRDMSSLHGRMSLKFPGSDWSPVYPTQRFCTLTTCFPHPPDRPPRDPDPDLMARFEADNRARPLYTYHLGNMVSRDGHVRPLSAGEEELLMGYPRGYTRHIIPPSSFELDQRAYRRRAIGNGFHIPSILILLGFLIPELAVHVVSASPTVSMAGENFKVQDTPLSFRQLGTCAPDCPQFEGNSLCTQLYKVPQVPRDSVWHPDFTPPTAWHRSTVDIFDNSLLLLPSDIFDLSHSFSHVMATCRSGPKMVCEIGNKVISTIGG